jgi:diguanylate cyclase (GGDEF)-like protein
VEGFPLSPNTSPTRGEGSRFSPSPSMGEGRGEGARPHSFLTHPAPTLSRQFAALFALLLLGFGNTLVLHQALSEHRGAAATINVAGTLRWLSQSIAYESQRLAAGASADRAGVEARLNRGDEAIRALLQGGESAGFHVGRLRPEYLAAIERIDGQWSAYRAGIGRLFGKIEARQDAAADLDRLGAEAAAMLAAADEAVAILTRHFGELEAAALSRLYLLGAIDLAVLIAAFVAIRRRLVRPLIDLSQASEEIAAGHYAARSGYRSRDEVGRLAAAFDHMAAEMEGNVRQIADDLAERVRYQDELERQATHDALTGLANRNLLNDRLRQALARAERAGSLVAVLFIDLDRFKYVNDSLGHAVGDELLKAVAATISGCVRDEDTVARLGGDEFVLVLADALSEDDTLTAMTRVLEAVSRQYRVAGHELHMSCSIGASLFPRDGRDAGTLLKNADTAMYRAKERGRNRGQFYLEEMNARLGERLSLENRLRHALERSELLLHYQPQVDLRSGAIVGAEALIRWREPELGLVSPDRFIPIAEETGLIVPIGEWVLETACAQAAAWRAAGLPRIRLAVNLSARQFRHKGLAEAIRRALQSNRLDPGDLELEITESMIVQEPAETIRLLESLKAIGLRIAVDDFGTGYSSLAYLKRFPIDVLKIDQSFVRGIAANRSDAAIARTVINLARSLYLHTVAEGVETAEQAGLLHDWTCDEAQGYLFSRPLPAEEFAALLGARQRYPVRGFQAR